MRLPLPLAFALTLSVWPAVAGQEPTADDADAPPKPPTMDTRITAVTLYSNQAMTVRRGTLQLPAGRSRWAVPALPAALVDAVVGARVLSGNGARLANIEVLHENRKVFKKKEAEEADQELKRIQERHKEVSDAISTLETEARLLENFEVGKAPAGAPEKPTPTPIDVHSWKDTLDFIGSSLETNREQLRAQRESLDGIEEELAVAAAHARKLASGKVLSEKTILLELESSRPVAAEIEVTYLVPGPGWWPRYDIRADVDAGTVELTSYALVRQESGEDWENVELTFSAAEPAQAADLPELLAWHIGEAEEQSQQADVAGTMVNTSPGLQTVSGGFALEQQARSRAASYGVNVAGQSGQQGAIPVQTELANLSSAQTILQQQKTRQAGLKQKRFAASKATRTQENLKRIQQLDIQNGVAFQQGRIQEFVRGNMVLQEEILNLDTRYQSYFSDVMVACVSNIKKGERLIKSARLADGIVPPVQSSRGYDYKYRAVRPETIPSDGAYNQVVIGSETLAADFIYEAAPELSELAFLTTGVKNNGRQPYLEGPASVFLGPDFVGNARVSTTVRGESFRVSLGANEAVRVQRKEDKKRETTGFFTSYHKYVHRVDLTVKNTKNRSVRVALLDRIPFTEDKAVTVERMSTQPDVTREDRKGLLRWEFLLEASNERKAAFSYTVELPADRLLTKTADGSVKW